ncbi:prepilin-type N-terminal cleavage/methylation domain-containing protein [Rubritalea squalenifaciens DSM 18772]|uniref:Prepilin-type N-terminal cleavage/methylation domain-containing protein n=1 Tax=Rubritalea squalenifaciens DSM 18772 TaxID=1123071 RepID=A0A1M6SRG4_9BACT|nr:type II secretion system protein [Rubritalea squalenifaciens]SHK47239.1 prepilin-type N-terminal cleavage/methylation domain-containing protein [Rubritalea squalenifaciens DSM 18772]
MKIKYKNRAPKGFTLVELLVVIAIIAGLAAMSYGPIMRNIKKSKQTEATSNMRQVLMALQSFATDNDGMYPNEDTTRSGQDGSTLEGCFNQLLSGKYINEEKYFYSQVNAEVILTSTKGPDNDGSLTTDECTTGYVRGLSSTSKPEAPILFDSAISPGKFDTAVWDGYAIVARIDQSVKTMPIDFTGELDTEDGGSKTGPIVEERGSRKINIFRKPFLPRSADVLVPSGAHGGSASYTDED